MKPIASLLCALLVFALSLAPLVSLQAGLIAGTAMVDGKPLANVTVRLRNIDTGELVGNAVADAQGAFSFSGLGPGNFVVETVGSNGTLLATSATIALSTATMVVTNIAVGTSSAAVSAAGGVGAGAGAGGAGAGATAGQAAGGAAAAGGSGAAAGGAAAGGAAAGGLGAVLGSAAGIIGLTAATISTTVLVTAISASGSQ